MQAAIKRRVNNLEKATVEAKRSGEKKLTTKGRDAAFIKQPERVLWETHRSVAKEIQIHPIGGRQMVVSKSLSVDGSLVDRVNRLREAMVK